MAGKHNFAPGSQRDSLVFGSSRPGFSKESEVPGGVNPADVANWCAFMKEQGITRILSLLGDDEVLWYDPDVKQQLAEHGFDVATRYTQTSVFTPNALTKIRAALQAADESGERIVVHCSGGGGRAALGLGVWLCDKYGLTPEDAAAEIGRYAEEAGVSRRADAAKIARLLQNGTLGK